jgi:predicted HTH transcriptional regulator
VREAVVNAIAHRNYEDGARQILVKLFADRIEILSPGEPMKPLAVSQIKRGNCQPCSRNPILGQYLNHLRLMDQRGSGIGRMKISMLNHGLDAPVSDLVDGYFRVTLKGPGEDLDRLRVPAGMGAGIPPAVEEQMNARQKRIVGYAVDYGKVTTNWVVSHLGISKGTAIRDLKGLCELGIPEVMGQGRGAHYVPKQTE